MLFSGSRQYSDSLCFNGEFSDFFMQRFEYNFLGLNKSYDSHIVVNDVRIKVRDAQCTLLIGKNGSGKTTLLKMISGLEKPDSGVVLVNSKSYKWGQCRQTLLKNVMYLHQQPYMFDGSVRKNLQFTLKASKKATQTIHEAIQWAGLEDIIDQDANSISGGEKQRVAIARAYLRSPQVVLLDEPTANLDHQSRIKTLELMTQFKQQGIAMIIASHDPDIFTGIQDERLQLDSTRLTNMKPRNKAKAAVTRIDHYKNNCA
jgi:tungstate transport system ATP-binding protein